MKKEIEAYLKSHRACMTEPVQERREELYAKLEASPFRVLGPVGLQYIEKNGVEVARLVPTYTGGFPVKLVEMELVMLQN